MKGGSAPIRIAHAYGNRRALIDQALAGPVDYIEADVWHQSGRLWLRHERRLGVLPLLFDHRGSQPRSLEPFALSIGPWYARLDLRPLPLDELLEKAKGRRRLLLEAKGRYFAAHERAFINDLAQLLAQYGMEKTTRICGQNWSLLQRFRQLAPHLSLQFSIERPAQWKAFLLLQADHPVSAVCLQRALIDAEKARFLAEKGIEVFSWTVDDREEAQRLLALGVGGIISNNLSLLAQLTDERRG